MKTFQTTRDDCPLFWFPVWSASYFQSTILQACRKWFDGGERERLLVRQAIRRFLQQSQQEMAGLVVKRYFMGKNEDLVTG